MESEIFGHVKGAFHRATAAIAKAPRYRPTGALLFLDEVAEMDIALLKSCSALPAGETGAAARRGHPTKSPTHA